MATDLMTAKEWQYFKFGKDLKLHPVDCGGDFVCDKGSVTEEGLETLIMLNLGELFPQWPLILSEKYMAGWAGPDIEAGDPTGCHHVFEVKYGAPTQDVIDQVMAYGLCAPRNQNKKWFYNQNSIEPEAIVSTRLAGFWSRRRVQTVAKNPGHTLDKKCEGLIRELTNDLSDLDYKTCIDLAREHLGSMSQQSWSCEPPPTRDVHLHVILPYGDEVSEYFKLALCRMRNRNVRATVWEVAVEVEKQALEGQLRWRQVHVNPVSPKDNKPTGDGGFCDVTGIIAHSWLRQSRDIELLHEYDGKNKYRFWPWRENAEYRVPTLCFDVQGDVLKVTANITVPGSRKDEGVTVMKKFIKDWFEHITSSIEFRSLCDEKAAKNGPVKAKKTSKTATLDIDLTMVKLEQIHALAAKTICEFEVLSEEHRDGFRNFR